MTSAGPGFERLPVGDNPAVLASNILKGAITPNVAFGIRGVTLDKDSAQFVVGPYTPRAPT